MGGGGCAPASDANTSTIYDDKRNDRLSAVAAGGNSKKYFGKEYTITEIENLNVYEFETNYTLDTEGKGREGKGREGKGWEGKGREGKGREGKGREGKDGKGKDQRKIDTRRRRLTSTNKI